MNIVRFAALGLATAGISLLGAVGGCLLSAYSQGDPFDVEDDD